MKRPQADPSIAVAEEVRAALRAYPDLYLAHTSFPLVVRGSFALIDESGPIDRFQIEITVPADFPDGEAIVREIGGRIPHLAERHVNPGGAACVCVPEEWLAMSDELSFEAFLGGPVRNYFLGQALTERGQPWPAGERSHGTRGVIEAFSDVLGTQTEAHLIALLKQLTQSAIGGHILCACGSGEITRLCHLQLVRTAQERVKPSLARKMLQRLGLRS